MRKEKNEDTNAELSVELSRERWKASQGDLAGKVRDSEFYAGVRGLSLSLSVSVTAWPDSIEPSEESLV